MKIQKYPLYSPKELELKRRGEIGLPPDHIGKALEAEGYHTTLAKRILVGADEWSRFFYMAPMQPLAVEIARKVTSKHNQDARVITVGTQGKGKSWLNLTLGYAIAREIARIKGGKWGDYFGMRNIVIMDDSKVKEVLSDVKQYHIYSFDDIGIAWNAREAMSKGNKMLNDVFQVFRTENTVVMMSIISDFMIDKVPRNLVTYQIEMDMSLFDYRWVFPKVFYVVGKPREHAPHYHYPRTTGDIAVVRVACPSPPKELATEYDVVRREAATKLRVERMKGDDENNGYGKAKVKPEYPNEWKYGRVEEMMEEGISQTKACKILKCDRTAFRNWRDDDDRRAGASA